MQKIHNLRKWNINGNAGEGYCGMGKVTKAGGETAGVFVCYHKLGGLVRSSAGRRRVRKIRKKEKICKELLSICEEQLDENDWK